MAEQQRHRTTHSPAEQSDRNVRSVWRTTVGVALGISGGLFGSSGIERMLSAQLYGVARFDPVTLAGASVLLALAGLLAVWWPARGAAKQNPLISLNEN